MPESSANAKLDEVDHIIAAWERERPDLDIRPLAVFSRISRLARRLDLARREAYAEQGLEIWEFDVLSTLRREGAPHELTPGQLISALLVSSGTMTNRIDRLQQQKLVERVPDLHDKRVVHVRLTPLGVAKVDAALTTLVKFEHGVIASLTTDEREELGQLLSQILVGLTN